MVGQNNPHFRIRSDSFSIFFKKRILAILVKLLECIICRNPPPQRIRTEANEFCSQMFHPHNTRAAFTFRNAALI